jgi:hypothetical protein
LIAQEDAYGYAQRLYPRSAETMKKPPYLIWPGPGPTGNADVENFRCIRRSAATTCLQPTSLPIRPSPKVRRHRPRRQSLSPGILAQSSQRSSAISQRTIMK